MRLLTRTEWIVLGMIMLYSFIPAVGGLIRVLELAGGPAIAPPNPRALAQPFPIVLHTLSSFVFCIAGATQFLPGLRRNHRAGHRRLGRVLVIAGCIAAASGVWMTHFFTFPTDLQGSALYWVRMVLGTAMIGCIVWAVIAIQSRNASRHSALILRAYALGQGASTQALFGIIWIAATGAEAMGTPREALMILGWLVNLLAAEVLIQSGRLQGRVRHPK